MHYTLGTLSNNHFARRETLFRRAVRLVRVPSLIEDEIRLVVVECLPCTDILWVEVAISCIIEVPPATSRFVLHCTGVVATSRGITQMPHDSICVIYVWWCQSDVRLQCICAVLRGKLDSFLR